MEDCKVNSELGNNKNEGPRNGARKQGKSMVVRFSYKVDDRNVSVLVVLYKTIRGLRITKIHQA